MYFRKSQFLLLGAFFIVSQILSVTLCGGVGSPGLNPLSYHFLSIGEVWHSPTWLARLISDAPYRLALNRLKVGLHLKMTSLFPILHCFCACPLLSDYLWKIYPLFVASTIHVWDTYLCKDLLSSRTSPLTSLFGDTAFPPALRLSHFLSWTKHSGTCLPHTLSQGTLPPLAWLLPLCHNPSTASLFSIYTSRRGTPLTHLWFWIPTHVLSQVYQLLMKEAYQTDPCFFSK